MGECVNTFDTLERMKLQGNLTKEDFVEYKRLLLVRCSICKAEYPKYKLTNGMWICERCKNEN
jgi:ribosomal protein L37AE/L43A